MGNAYRLSHGLHRLGSTDVGDVHRRATRWAHIQFAAVHNRRHMVQFSWGSHGQLFFAKDRAIVHREPLLSTHIASFAVLHLFILLASRLSSEMSPGSR